MVDIILRIVEYIGVISFAISGTVIAISKKTDGVGALVFALLSHCQPQLNPIWSDK